MVYSQTCHENSSSHFELGPDLGDAEDQGFTRKGWSAGRLVGLGSSSPSSVPLKHPCLPQPFLPS